MKKLRREEWMLVPPKSGDLLACTFHSTRSSLTCVLIEVIPLDLTKARPRQFARSAASVVAVFVCTRTCVLGPASLAFSP
ncbi:hypothetical protein EV424DRAFT_1646719 [Suillus variegatus]|nr:hypothetical protein EV424DRAFT_1646719 [Suillus variegatus]